MEASGVWWPPRSSKPLTRLARVVGSIPIRFRHFQGPSWSLTYYVLSDGRR